MKKRKNFLIICSALFFFAFFFSFSFANDLEIAYPPMPGVQTPETTETELGSYIKYFFNFAFAAAGLLLFIVIIQGGLLYSSSAGNLSKAKIAKEKIVSGFLGVGIILCSWLLLYTLNPRLLLFSFEKNIIPASITVPEEEKIERKRSFLQIPIGALIEKALTGSEAQAMLYDVGQKNQDLKEKAEELKNLNEELKNLSLACKCGDSTCGSVAENCQGQGSGCKISCDQKAIDEKINEIRSFIKELEDFQKNSFVSTRWDFDGGRNELRIAASLLTGACETPIMTQNDMMQASAMIGKDGFEIKTLAGWPSNKLSLEGKMVDDPITFYCESPDISGALGATSFEDVLEIVAVEDYPDIPSDSAPRHSTPPEGSQDYKLKDNQNTYPYLNQSSSVEKCIRWVGCGPTSLATIIRYFDSSSKTTAESLAKEFESQGSFYYCSCTSQSCTGGVTSAASASSYVRSQYGINYERLERNPQTIKNEILKNRPVLIASCVFGPYAKYGGHLLVINGVNYTGDDINYFYVMDPCHYNYLTISLRDLNKCGAYVYSFSK